jgi:uncharacterized protein YndB with AHSA1/START domain
MSVTHDTFVLERTLPVPPARVFRAFADEAEKSKWFGGPEAWTEIEKSMDFRVGGRDVSAGGPPDGPAHRYVAEYRDIVEDERIITAYDMYLGGTRISVSVSTVELTAVDGGTRLVLTEQGAYLDGADAPDQRRHGMSELLDALAATLAP